MRRFSVADFRNSWVTRDPRLACAQPDHRLLGPDLYRGPLSNSPDNRLNANQKRLNVSEYRLNTSEYRLNAREYRLNAREYRLNARE